MPVLRRPLRERRNVQLKVVTPSYKEDEVKSTTNQTKHNYIKAKAPVRGGRRSRLSHGQGKLAPRAHAPHAQQDVTTDENQPGAVKKAVEEARPKKKTSTPAPLSRELNLDIDDNIELESFDQLPTDYGHLTPSSDPASPTYMQDIFSGDVSFHPSEIDEASFSLAYEEPSFYAAGQEDLQSMHEFLPFLFIAFSDGQYTSDSLKASYGIDFTHIVKIAYPSLTNDDNPGSISTSVNKCTGVQTLTLTIASPQSHSRSSSTGSLYGDSIRASPARRRKGGRRHARTGISQRMFTLLTEEQLLAARDFLSLALPYYLEARPTTKRMPSENVAVLVTAPGGSQSGLDGMDMDDYGMTGYGYNRYGDDNSDKGGAADIISAIACYLSFASETPVETVLSYIDEEECLGAEWKDAISRDEDGVGFVQMVAAM